jgi:hypothetical protein
MFPSIILQAINLIKQKNLNAMSRLIVEAVSNSRYNTNNAHLNVLVSVTWADTGKPAIGLNGDHFRITNINVNNNEIPSVFEGKEIYGVQVSERKWNLTNEKGTGVYDITVAWFDLNIGGIQNMFFKTGQVFSFGLQVKTPVQGSSNKTDFGQTVISLTNRGGSKL